jgi:hypothetical protein
MTDMVRTFALNGKSQPTTPGIGMGPNMTPEKWKSTTDVEWGCKGINEEARPV